MSLSPNPIEEGIMNRSMMKWLARGAFATMVAGAMLVAGPRDLAAYDCPEPNAGTCPPLTPYPGPNSCDQACKDLGWQDGGTCVGPCCTCFMR
jgi:hypothetical protein